MSNLTSCRQTVHLRKYFILLDSFKKEICTANFQIEKMAVRVHRKKCFILKLKQVLEIKC